MRLRASALHLVDTEPGVEDLARWYGQAMALPTLVTRDGEPVMLCRVEMTTNLDRQALHAALEEVAVSGFQGASSLRSGLVGTCVSEVR